MQESERLLVPYSDTGSWGEGRVTDGGGGGREEMLTKG
jgi:hypothetical protein